jgi:hypothetical protein
MARIDRAVEVLYNAGTSKDPDWSVGSGYLIGGRLVLTAAHNVGDGQCLVRLFDGTEHPAAVRRRGDRVRLDLALLELTGSDAPEFDHPVQYAIVSQEQAGLVERCTGLGFPQFKEDETRPRPGSGKPLRNIEQLDGEIPAGAGARAKLLTFRVRVHPREPLPTKGRSFGESPWQGISGATVFADDAVYGERAVGVVTEHHLPEGSSALTLVPIGAIGTSEVLSAAVRKDWWDLLGVPDPDRLPVLPRESSRGRPRPPAPPRGAVARQQTTAAALTALRDEPAPLVALVGGPGFGKTVLARLIASDVDTQAGSGAGQGDVFCPGGVVWLDVGLAPDLSGLLGQCLTDLTGQPPGGRSVEQLASDLGEELAARRCLLVLDDVWPSQTGKYDIAGFLLSRIGRVPRLVTTRSAALLGAEPGARNISVAEMEPSEAAAVLARALPREATRSEMAPLDELARRLGRWPLLVGLAAASLRRWVSDGLPLDDALRHLGERYAAKGVTAFDSRHAHLIDAKDPAQRQRAVTAAIEASLGLLNPDDQARYRELAAFPPGQPIPVDVIADLWAPVLDRYDTYDLLTIFADLSLASMDLRTGNVRVHDLLHNYLVRIDAQQVAVLHRRVLRSWGDPMLLQDSYRIRWYAYHLDAAGESAGLYALLIPAWRDRVLAVTGALSDVAADALRAAEHAGRRHDLPEELRCRLIATSLAARSQALPRAVFSALAKLGRVDRALGDAALLPREDRDRALGSIAAAVADTGYGQALAIADRIDDPWRKELVLADIAAALARSHLSRAISVTQRIQNSRTKAKALANIAAALAGTAHIDSSPMTEQALAVSEDIHDPEAKDRALAGIACVLARTDPDKALDITERIGSPRQKVQALTGIAIAIAFARADPDRALEIAQRMTRLPESFHNIMARSHIIRLASSDLSPAVAAVWCVSNAERMSNQTAWAISTLASGFSDTELDQALDDPSPKIKAPKSKARMLADITAAIAGVDPDRALGLTERIETLDVRAEAVADIADALASIDPDRASRLTDQAVALAARVNAKIDVESAKSWAFARCAAGLARTDLSQALTAAERITDPAALAWALADIAAAVSSSDPDHASRLIDQALGVADGITDRKARTLADIAVALSGSNLGRALNIANSIQGHEKARALAGIATALADIDPDRALTIADRIGPPNLAPADAAMYQAPALAHIAAAFAHRDGGRARQLADRAAVNAVKPIADFSLFLLPPAAPGHTHSPMSPPH